MAIQQQIGKTGEEMAVAYLQSQGHRVLHRNWRNRHLEIDIVTLDREELVFVEVKCRSSVKFGEPYHAVDCEKQRKLILAANAYIRRYRCTQEVRFDIVSIDLGSSSPVAHIKNAFYPLA